MWLEPQPCFIPGLKGAQARDGARGHVGHPCGEAAWALRSNVGDVGDGEHRPMSVRSARDRYEICQRRRLVHLSLSLSLALSYCIFHAG